MKIQVVCLVVFALSTSVMAQAPARSSGDPISQAIRDGWNGAKRNLSGAASTMPEAKYGFTPVDSVRTFGQIVAHVAGANYIFCAAARVEKSPHAEDAFEKSATTVPRSSRRWTTRLSTATSLMRPPTASWRR
jgi:hypothetical protein